MSIFETVRIARDNSDGLGDYTIINKRDVKKGQKLWDEKAHIAKAAEAEKFESTTDLARFTVAELKQQLANKDLSTTGKKQDLIDRLTG